MDQILKTWELEGYRRVEILPTLKYGKSLPLVLHRGTKYDLPTRKIRKSGAASTDLYLTKCGWQVLSAIEGNVAVVSIVGPACTGKSFIISAILGDLNVFPVGHDINSATRGLWISTIGMQKRNGDTVVFIDSKGTDDPSSEDNTGVNLSLIALLSSSLYIYNGKSTFKGSDCEFLTRVIRKLLSQTSAPGFSDPRHYRFRPDFLWLIHDMQMKLTVDGRSVSADTFFKKKILYHWPGGRILCNVFQEVCCKEIPFPATDRRFLADMVQNPRRLSQQFCETLKHIIRAHVCTIRTNRSNSNGEFLSGRKLAVYMESLLQDMTTKRENSRSSVVASGEMCHEEGSKCLPVRNREHGTETNSRRLRPFPPRRHTEHSTIPRKIYPKKNEPNSDYNEQLKNLKRDIQRNKNAQLRGKNLDYDEDGYEEDDDDDDEDDDDVDDDDDDDEDDDDADDNEENDERDNYKEEEDEDGEDGGNDDYGHGYEEDEDDDDYAGDDENDEHDDRGGNYYDGEGYEEEDHDEDGDDGDTEDEYDGYVVDGDDNSGGDNEISDNGDDRDKDRDYYDGDGYEEEEEDDDSCSGHDDDDDDDDDDDGGDDEYDEHSDDRDGSYSDEDRYEEDDNYGYDEDGDDYGGYDENDTDGDDRDGYVYDADDYEEDYYDYGDAGDVYDDVQVDDGGHYAAGDGGGIDYSFDNNPISNISNDGGHYAVGESGGIDYSFDNNPINNVSNDGGYYAAGEVAGIDYSFDSSPFSSPFSSDIAVMGSEVCCIL